MTNSLVRTEKDPAALILRLGLGLVMFPHGAQKLLGWFGGYGFAGTMHFFTSTMGIPYGLGLLVIIVEFFGALGLITGLLTRLAALGVAVDLTVAALMVHVHNGFFMNWTGQQAGEGFEYHILAVAIAIALIIKGGGLWSLDRLFGKKGEQD